VSGSIPPGLVVSGNIVLANNKFTGNIPPEFGEQFHNYLDLSYNQLSGDIPASPCN
jgi:hypothetical protein